MSLKNMKSFLRKANGRISAGAFLEAQAEYLKNNFEETVPVFEQLENKLLYPTDALIQCKVIVFEKMRAEENAEATAKILAREKIKEHSEPNKKVTEPKEEKSKAHCVTIYDERGNVIERRKDDKVFPVVAKFDKYQDAERWAYRRLHSGEKDWYAEIVSIYLLDNSGNPIKTRINRVNAAAVIGHRLISPAMKRRPKSTGRLSGVAKAKQTYARFSGG